jgi:hypothetical protein
MPFSLRSLCSVITSFGIVKGKLATAAEMMKKESHRRGIPSARALLSAASIATIFQAIKNTHNNNQR